jgi:hypothetical protein
MVSAAAQRLPTDLPNSYRLVPSWPLLPQTMNGGKWGEVIRVHVARDGTIWVFHRCFNTVPPGHATCINRGEANPPILQFDPSGRLLKGFGVGMFAYPHAFTMDHTDGIGSAKDGNLIAFIPDPSDLNRVEWGSSASGIAVDGEGSIFAADVGTHGLCKYVKAK